MLKRESNTELPKPTPLQPIGQEKVPVREAFTTGSGIKVEKSELPGTPKPIYRGKVSATEAAPAPATPHRPGRPGYGPYHESQPYQPRPGYNPHNEPHPVQPNPVYSPYPEPQPY